MNHPESSYVIFGFKYLYDQLHPFPIVFTWVSNMPTTNTLIFILFFMATCHAISFIPMHDLALLNTSDAVVIGNKFWTLLLASSHIFLCFAVNILQRTASPDLTYPNTVYRAQIRECIKGGLVGTVSITVPGTIGCLFQILLTLINSICRRPKRSVRGHTHYSWWPRVFFQR